MELSPEERFTAVAASMATVTAAAEAAGLVAIAELALQRRREAGPRGLHQDQADEFTADEVGALLRLSRPAARARLFLALDLRTRRPATLTALSTGQISLTAARRISDALAPLAPDIADAVERDALHRAPQQTPAQLSARLTRLILRADPTAARTRAHAAVRDRHCSIRVLDNGTALLSILGRTDLVAAAYERIDTIARSITQPTTNSDTGSDSGTHGSSADNSGAAGAPLLSAGRALDQTRADLTLGLLLGDPQATTASTGVHVTLDVITPISTLLPGTTLPTDKNSTSTGRASTSDGTGDTGTTSDTGGTSGGTASGDTDSELPGELLGYGPIPAHLVRELAEDATWRRWSTEDPTPMTTLITTHTDASTTSSTGGITGRGRTRYRPSTAMKQLLRLRDGTCRFPTCRRRATACDLDHVTPWPQGPTHPRNLATLCRHHHRLKHHAGWHVRLTPDGDLHWTTPAGTTHTSPARRLSDLLQPPPPNNHTGNATAVTAPAPDPAPF